MANIVVFGKAQSGKSTLLGYLYSQLNRNFNIYEFEKNIMNELGCDYVPSYLYAYIMDETRYERFVRKGTRTMHVRKILFDENTRVTIIDTPGVEHYTISKQRGVFLGDIGIFCLELIDVISEDFLVSSKENNTIISSLLLWANLGHKSIIVALTKCDKSKCLVEDYRIATERVNELCGKTKINSVTIIPISVIVSQKIGNNIVGRSSEFSWYRQDTLYEALDKKIINLLDIKKEELLFCIYNQIDKPSSKAGKVWMIKIIQGEISVDDQIIISPVLTKNKEFISVCATVKTIRYDLNEDEEKQIIKTASAGEIVGIDLKNIHCKNERIDKKSFDTIYTTCGFDSNVNFVVSDTFVFSIKIEYDEIFTLNREFCLIWFGRSIPFTIYKQPYTKNNQIYISAKIKSRKLALPVYKNGEYYFKQLIIKDDNNKTPDPYYEGVLIKIGEENQDNEYN